MIRLNPSTCECLKDQIKTKEIVLTDVVFIPTGDAFNNSTSMLTLLLRSKKF